MQSSVLHQNLIYVRLYVVKRYFPHRPHKSILNQSNIFFDRKNLITGRISSSEDETGARFIIRVLVDFLIIK